LSFRPSSALCQPLHSVLCAGWHALNTNENSAHPGTSFSGNRLKAQPDGSRSYHKWASSSPMRASTTPGATNRSFLEDRSGSPVRIFPQQARVSIDVLVGHGIRRRSSPQPRRHTGETETIPTNSDSLARTLARRIGLEEGAASVGAQNRACGSAHGSSRKAYPLTRIKPLRGLPRRTLPHLKTGAAIPVAQPTASRAVRPLCRSPSLSAAKVGCATLDTDFDEIFRPSAARGS
jgi:hypothetical protein